MTDDVNQKVNRFWVPDAVIDTYIRELKLSPFDFAVYAAHCRYSNREGITFVGIRRIAQQLRISPATVHKSIKKLEACYLLVRLDRKNGRASNMKIYPVPSVSTLPSQRLVHKELELNKESNETVKNNTMSPKEKLIQNNPALFKRLYGYTP